MNILEKYSMVPGVGIVVFDPVTLAVVSVGATLAAGGVKAVGDLQAGDAAKKAGQVQAQQLRQNASQAEGSAQRTMLDTQERGRLAASKATAEAGASGVSSDIGSPLENTGQLAARTSYHSLMDMFNGESAASGMRYQADVAEWEGKTKKKASYLSAGGDVLSSIGSATGNYAKITYPTSRGGTGASL